MKLITRLLLLLSIVARLPGLADSYADAGTASGNTNGVITLDQKSFAKADLALAHVTATDGKTVIPVSAVVWRDGKAWVYVQKSTGSYARQPVNITGVLPGDHYAVTGLSADAAIIIRGTQLLLSQEFGGNSNLQYVDEDD